MFNGFGVLFGIALVAAIIVLLDKIAQRKERQSKDRAA
jgi:hypothetical protein